MRSAGQFRAVWARRSLFFVLGLITLATLYVHEGYVLRPADPQWAHFAPFRLWLVPHVVCAVTALLIGPLQFSATIRLRNLRLHRWLGRIYVIAVSIAAPLSLYIIVVFEQPWNWWSMGTMGGLWLLTTLVAWWAAWRRNIGLHRLWIARSYCFTFTFVLTRFVPDVIFPGMGYVSMTALYWGISVACLIVPEFFLGRSASSIAN